MICRCYHCRKELGELSFQLFRNIFMGYDNIGRRKPFCSEQCYNEYIQQYQVAEYKGRPIYKVEKDGVIGYMPWWFSPYYFTDIDSCKKRMDMTNIAIFPSFK